MKKTIFTLTLLTFVLILAACGSSTSEVGSNENDNQEFTLPLDMQLLIGTVKLDESENAIDAEQAAELLPLWKALRSLSESETAASAEVEALVNQIQDSMTSEQIEAIEAMELSMSDFADVRETLGIEGGFGDITPEMQATMEAARESGEFPTGGRPGGDIPGGGQGPGGGQELSAEARQTAIAERGGTRGAGLGLNTALLEGIIEFLETMSQ
ncbi:MAG: hypothetical protein ISR58_15705 [Anaerolineales bacterium]|nr:hypothetical protein [Chloroflexota bacterium]MBL6982618.1 hypothetical protein [Anaerolineales bacterium]